MTVYLVCIDAHVSDGSSEVFVFAVVYVTTRLGVDVLLGQAEVDHVYNVTVAPR